MPTVQQAVTLMPELIRLDRVSVHLDDRDILKNVDFSLHKNEIVTLIGPNGAGKSTLIKVLLGIVHPSRGKVITSKKNKMSNALMNQINYGIVKVTQLMMITS